MPRHERTKSGTGIYHVMLRGINKQDIFVDHENRPHFLSQRKTMVREYANYLD